jgi:hypothetical protein
MILMKEVRLRHQTFGVALAASIKHIPGVIMMWRRIADARFEGRTLDSF